MEHVKQGEGLLTKLDRISRDAEQRAEQHGFALDNDAKALLRFGVLWAITDKGE